MVRCNSGKTTFGAVNAIGSGRRAVRTAWAEESASQRPTPTASIARAGAKAVAGERSSWPTSHNSAQSSTFMIVVDKRGRGKTLLSKQDVRIDGGGVRGAGLVGPDRHPQRNLTHPPIYPPSCQWSQGRAIHPAHPRSQCIWCDRISHTTG